MESPSYFRNKAEQCRRLAACITTRNDMTAGSLKAMAIEFDAMAAAADADSGGRRVRDHVCKVMGKLHSRSSVLDEEIPVSTKL
jgi:hypothetical protein